MGPVAMDERSYRENLLAAVGSLADAEGIFNTTAFSKVSAEALTEAGELDDVTIVDFEGIGGRRRKMAVNGYDLGNADNSIGLLVTLFQGGTTERVVSTAEAKAAVKALRSYLMESVDGSFFDGREESSAAYQLATDLNLRGRNVSRYRLYLVTDGHLSDRLRELPEDELNGVPIEHHLWDINRFHQLHASTSGREPLEIDLKSFGMTGMNALKVQTQGDDFTTYLAAVPGELLASLYGKYGSRLLESNVRSYLTNRGRINKGIRSTILSAPRNFMAFNNGITATATSVLEEPGGGQLTKITDLQIVNGGQTTASLFFVDKDAKGGSVLDDVFVPMKLVVVDPRIAEELVPNISRYANSQNAVSAADFFSNSPFHIRVEELSRRVIAPAVSGATFSTKWYYERTRGQYENEKSKLSKAEAARFERLYPKNQKFDKPSLAKYIMSWEQRPNVVSTGAQKNFIAFANLVAASWEKDDSTFNEAYFRDAVVKAMLYNAVRNEVLKSPWYKAQRAYLPNIVAYTVSKLAHSIESQGRGRVLDTEAIWKTQGVPKSVLEFAEETAPMVNQVLISDSRPVTNVAEWAKKPGCWSVVEAMKTSLSPTLLGDLVDPQRLNEAKRAAKSVQKIDNSISEQTRVVATPGETWESLRSFALQRGLASPKDVQCLDVASGRRRGIPTEWQASRLLKLLENAKSQGFIEI